MHKDYRSYDILKSFDQTLLKSLKVDDTLPTITHPFTISKGDNGQDLYEPIDLVFYNTSAFSATGKEFTETGLYTSYHPIYNKKEFDAFWDREEERRRKGFTLPAVITEREDGSFCLQNLHISKEHYGYLNFAPIKRLGKEDLKSMTDLVHSDENSDDIAAKKVTDFPQFFDSDYYYFKILEIAEKKGKHVVVGKARRKGYSFKNGWLGADKVDLYKNSTTVLGAFNSDSLYPDGTMNMCDNYLQHIAQHTDWSKRRLSDRSSFIKMGYKVNDGLGIEYGFKSKIIAVSFAPNNTGAARGKDADRVILEESGKNPILTGVLNSTLPTLGAGVAMTGQMIVFGTGGGGEKQWEGFENLFYSPSADDFIALNNIWDDHTRGSECGFFVASYMGKEGYVDEHGNSDVVGAIAYEEKEREKKKKSKDPSKLSNYKMEEPFTPSEAFSRSSSGIFQQEEFTEQLRRIQHDDDIKSLIRTGNLVRTTKGVSFRDKMFMTDAELDNFHPPVVNFPLGKDDDPHGCFCMVEPPYRDRRTGLIPEGMYRIWHDPFAIDKDSSAVSSRDSLAVFYVYKKTNNITPDKGDRIVGWFRGRPSSTDEVNDIMFKAADYYSNGDTDVILFENDRGDVKNYARRHKRLHQLSDEPDVVWKTGDNVKKTGRNKGISINTNRKFDGVIYAKDWFGMKRSTDEFGKELLNLHYYFDEAGCKEILRFRLDKGNFDAVSTIIVGQFDIKEQFFRKIENPHDSFADADNIFNRELF